ncbi:MAG: SIS domain-containing protein [Elusimicrobiota bacterium]|jgi:glucosamine--fructose-6-phosphate aminotransferase (isomerizing)
MKITDTQTWNDIREIPALLEAFSQDAPSRLQDCALKSGDDSVHLVGRGSSNNATLFAKYIWETHAGVRTEFVHPHAIFEAELPLNFRDRVVWAFSQSGRSPDIVECLQKLMHWGATGIAVTNEPALASNPLAAKANRHILLSHSRESVVAATKTFSLQLWLALWTSHLWRGWPSASDLADTRVRIERFLDDPSRLPPAGQFAPIWPFLMKSKILALVGRGPLYAVARDAALKFREMAGLQAVAYSAADFLHGPIGACGPKDLILLLSPSRRRLPPDLGLVDKALRQRGNRPHTIAPASGSAPLNSLVLDVELKLAALALAVKKGLDPDRPKGLKKVTLTR